MSIFSSFFNSELSDEAQTKFDLARLYYDKKKYKKAYKAILEAEELDPDNEKIKDLKIQIECTLEEAKTKVVLDEDQPKDEEPNLDPWIVFSSESIDESEIRFYTARNYYIENVAYGDNTWHVLLRVKEEKDPEQTFFITDQLDNDTFNTYIEDRFVITSLAYDQNKWMFVLEYQSNADAQAWSKTHKEFPSADLEEWGNTNGKLEQLLEFKSTFFTSASFPNTFENYLIEKHKDFPKDRIRELWDDDYYIDKLFNADKHFFLVFCEHPDWEDQSYVIDPDYPSADILKKMAEGYSIGNLFYDDERWYVLYNLEKKIEAQITETQNEEKDDAPVEEEEDSNVGIQEIELEEALEDLDALVGMANIKNEIKAITNYLKIGKLKEASGMELKSLNLHMIFSGSPGTGKTTVARLLGRIFKALGLLEKGHFVETDRSGLVGEYIGKTAGKTKAKIEESMGGILFIDEAYALYKDGNDFGNEALETILKEMEDKRDQFCVIFAGYPKEMSALLESNSGLKSRFGSHLTFENFTSDELFAILKKMLLDARHQMTLDAEKASKKYLTYLANTANRFFGNAREVRNLIEDLFKNQATRLNAVLAADKGTSLSNQQLKTITLADLRKSYAFNYQEKESLSYDDIIQELNELVGLENIKEDVTRLAHFLKLQTERIEKGISSERPNLHAVFLGPSGTGKTTVARLLAKIYHALGLVKKEVLVEVGRNDLVAGYVGQTAIKTNKVIDKALHGILFIDEAYALTDRGAKDFGHEAVETILKRMEDDRHRLVVIVAGYEDEMVRFLKSNPGLESRFSRKFYFQSFEANELEKIFHLMVKNANYQLDANAKTHLSDIIQEVVKMHSEHFGNARWVRNLLEHCIMEQAQRLHALSSVDEKTLQRIEKIDLENAYKTMQEENVINKHEQRNKLGF